MNRVFHDIVHHVFNPAWNADHRTTIWTSIVIVLFLSGVGLPLPEDLPLTASGFTTFKQCGDQFIFWRYVVTFITVVTPILLGDLCAYSMGRKFGMPMRDRSKIVRKVLSDKRVARVQRWFDNYGSFTVFLGRQVAGVRFVTFYTAGTMRMNVFKFLFWDFMGAFISVPVWLTLGTLAASYGQRWMHHASRTVGSTFLIVVAVMALGLFIFAKVRGSRDGDAPAKPETETPK